MNSMKELNNKREESFIYKDVKDEVNVNIANSEDWDGDRSVSDKVGRGDNR